MSDEAWSASGMIYAVEYLLDDEGRPVSERRAANRVKAGVPMELKSCPYRDERKGHPMNVSALAEITRHLDPVLDDVRAFRSARTSTEAGWNPMFAAVVDQLSGPALHLLRTRDPSALIPARRAVGHKLAAGFYGVVRGLLREQALGRERAITVEEVLSYVKSSRSLIGASEACAGPLHLIAKATAVFLGEGEETGAPHGKVSAEHVEIIDALCAQLRLGVLWELFDLQMERSLLLEAFARGEVIRRNPYIERVLGERLQELGDRAPQEREGLEVIALPQRLSSASRLRLQALLSGREVYDSTAPIVTTLLEVMTRGEVALELREEAQREAVARNVARYFLAYRELLSAHAELERTIRERLGYSVDIPLRPNALIVPIPTMFRWTQAVLGHRLEVQPESPGAFALRNHRRTVALES